ncbi:MAG: polyprenyl synthetase family protein [Armatimonadetes bacterium]|nr:polyprenyl synthetase family protein [Armatimonadota bacterium]
MSAVQDLGLFNIKQMPAEKRVRDAMRRLAADIAAGMDCTRPPSWEDFESRGRDLLNQLSYDAAYLGYAMVCISNAFWKPQFGAVPASRRLFLIPHCLSDQSKCPGKFDSEGLHCAGCGSCNIYYLKAHAESLGYSTLVAEGTPAVVLRVLEGDTDAILGVACLDSLETSFARISEFGIPYIAAPLLTDGCANTQAELDEIESMLSWTDNGSVGQTRSYLKLLRETAQLFEDGTLADLLSPYLAHPNQEASSPLTMTEDIAIDWLRRGGKRLRPFITMAAYAVGAFGENALDPSFEPAESIPPAVRRLAIAIEAMHKASLIHDDVEDDDEFRYGRQTIHRSHGIAPAINIGDYLVGLGYRLVSGEAEALGAEKVADILGNLASAHLDLCLGQGAELLWQDPDLLPLDALQVYSLKTTPAFEVALYSGLRTAGCDIDNEILHKFCVYVGEAYQILNDLDDWEDEDSGHSVSGLDALAQRPTILRAFALEAGGGKKLAQLAKSADHAQAVAEIKKLYESLGAFDKTERLFVRLRGRALDAALEMASPDLRELLGFLARIVLPRRSSSRIENP